MFLIAEENEGISLEKANEGNSALDMKLKH
jgi:hypothetical protein